MCATRQGIISKRNNLKLHGLNFFCNHLFFSKVRDVQMCVLRKGSGRKGSFANEARAPKSASWWTVRGLRQAFDKDV